MLRLLSASAEAKWKTENSRQQWLWIRSHMSHQCLPTPSTRLTDVLCLPYLDGVWELQRPSFRFGSCIKIPVIYRLLLTFSIFLFPSFFLNRYD